MSLKKRLRAPVNGKYSFLTLEAFLICVSCIAYYGIMIENCTEKNFDCNFSLFIRETWVNSRFIVEITFKIVKRIIQD